MCIKDYSPETYHILSKMVCKHQSKHPEFSSSQIQQSLNRAEKVFNATYTFWKELKSKGIFHTDTFWYFEPFAWVTQMMNVLKWDFKTEEDGWPVDLFYMKKSWERYIASGVGKRNPTLKTASTNHQGIDINFLGGGNTDLGAPVYATHDGFVHMAKDTTSGKGGRYIELISHNRKIMTRYLHLNKLFVKRGDLINKGQKIGEIGASYLGEDCCESAISTHLHYEIRRVDDNLKYSNIIDPTEGKGKETKSTDNLLDPNKLINTLLLFVFLLLSSCSENRNNGISQSTSEENRIEYKFQYFDYTSGDRKELEIFYLNNDSIAFTYTYNSKDPNCNNSIKGIGHKIDGHTFKTDVDFIESIYINNDMDFVTIDYNNNEEEIYFCNTFPKLYRKLGKNDYYIYSEKALLKENPSEIANTIASLNENSIVNIKDSVYIDNNLWIKIFDYKSQRIGYLEKTTLKKSNSYQDDFLSFFHKFKQDSLFQKNSIVFPIKIYTYDDNDNINIERRDKQSFYFLDFSKDSTAYLSEGDAYRVSLEYTKDSVSYKEIGIDNGINIYFVFKKNQKWQLTDIYDFSN